jgi:plastocyanin
MRRLVLVLMVVGSLAGAAPATAATVTVRIVKAGFTPTSVTINADDSVSWWNRDTVSHQVVSTTGAFASPVIRPGQRWSYTFRNGGTYRYRDALEPTERATVVVRGRPPSVTLGADPSILMFGDQAHLRGTISSGRSGESVTLFQQPYGQGSATQLAVAVTGAAGAFDVVVRPEILTAYYVRYRNSQSGAISVQIRPRITLVKRAARTLVTRVTADRSFAGHSVYVQKRTNFGQWVNVRKLKLGPNSGRTFRMTPSGPTRYRVFMTVNQAGAGYLASWSKSVVVPRKKR